MVVYYPNPRCHTLYIKPREEILTDDIRRRAGIGITYWKFQLDFLLEPYEEPKGSGRWCKRYYKQTIMDYVFGSEDQRGMGQHLETGKSIIFYGPAGRGKTSLAANVLKQALSRGARCLHTSASRMVDQLTAKTQQYSPTGVPIDVAVRQIHFLLIDDLEMEDVDWRKRVARDVIKYRYDMCLPTLITSNSQTNLLFHEEWFKSRMRERFIGIKVDGPDYRQKPEDRG